MSSGHWLLVLCDLATRAPRVQRRRPHAADACEMSASSPASDRPTFGCPALDSCERSAYVRETCLASLSVQGCDGRHPRRRGLPRRRSLAFPARGYHSVVAAPALLSVPCTHRDRRPKHPHDCAWAVSHLYATWWRCGLRAGLPGLNQPAGVGVSHARQRGGRNRGGERHSGTTGHLFPLVTVPSETEEPAALKQPTWQRKPDFCSVAGLLGSRPVQRTAKLAPAAMGRDALTRLETIIVIAAGSLRSRENGDVRCHPAHITPNARCQD